MNTASGDLLHKSFIWRESLDEFQEKTAGESFDEAIQAALDAISGTVVNITTAGVSTGNVKRVMCTIWYTA